MTQIKTAKQTVSENLYFLISVKYPQVSATIHHFDGSWFVTCDHWEKFELATEKEAITRAKKMIASNIDDIKYS
jgi:hypothetical protein